MPGRDRDQHDAHDQQSTSPVGAEDVRVTDRAAERRRAARSARGPSSPARGAAPRRRRAPPPTTRSTAAGRGRPRPRPRTGGAAASLAPLVSPPPPASATATSTPMLRVERGRRAEAPRPIPSGRAARTRTPRPRAAGTAPPCRAPGRRTRSGRSPGTGPCGAPSPRRPRRRTPVACIAQTQLTYLKDAPTHPIDSRRRTRSNAQLPPGLRRHCPGRLTATRFRAPADRGLDSITTTSTKKESSPSTSATDVLDLNPVIYVSRTLRRGSELEDPRFRNKVRSGVRTGFCSLKDLEFLDSESMPRTWEGRRRSGQGDSHWTNRCGNCFRSWS